MHFCIGHHYKLLVLNLVVPSDDSYKMYLKPISQSVESRKHLFISSHYLFVKGSPMDNFLTLPSCVSINAEQNSFPWASKKKKKPWGSFSSWTKTHQKLDNYIIFFG